MSVSHFEVVTYLGLIALVFIHLWLFRDCRTDAFRQEMFALRDALFLKAMDEGIPHDHPAYLMLRTTMNGWVRFAHRLNLPMTVMLMVARYPDRDKARSYTTQFEAALSGLTPHQKKMLINQRQQMHHLMLGYLMKGSPIFLYGLIFPALIFGFAKHWARKVFGKLDRPMDRLDSAGLLQAQA